MNGKLFVTLGLLVATPTLAQDIGGAWRAKGNTISVKAAGITLPDRAGATALTKTGEFSNQGIGIDNYAQYKSDDGKVFATAYVYRTTYADAALAAYATDLAVRDRFGSDVKLASQSVVPAAGQPRGAIRSVYTQAVLKGDPLVTTSAFIRVDGWVVKLRASGPAERGDEVTAALDALIDGLAVVRKATVFAASPLVIAAPCPAIAGDEAKLVTGEDTMGDALLGGTSGGSVAPTDKKGNTTAAPTFPANGATEACVRGTLTVGQRGIDLLQPAGEADPGIVLAVLNDAGSVLSIERSLLGQNYTVKSYTVAQVEVRGALDRIPPLAQLQGWLASDNAAPLAVRSRTSFVANGDSTIEINSAQLGK